jgi:heat-inducible transcription repressor HrcA
MSFAPSLVSPEQLDARARDIFREIVETYLATGEPVGSRTLAKRGIPLSPASIRNTMADLMALGAGRRLAWVGRARADPFGPAAVHRRADGDRAADGR